MGEVSAIGSQGKKTEYDTGVIGVDSQGTATLGAMQKSRKGEYINGVKVVDRMTQESWAHHDAPPLLDRFRYAPTEIIANTSERDEMLRSSKKYKKRLMDTAGHADFLGKVMSDGLREASRQRYKQSSRNRLDEAFVYWLVGLNTAELLLLRDITAIGRIGILASILLAGDLAMAKSRSSYYGYDMKDAQVSALLGQDRRIGAYALAKTQRFVSYRK